MINNVSDDYKLGYAHGYAECAIDFDLISVVRCKDCKYKVGENTEYNDAHCGIHERGNNRELTVGDYDYCSWGELKESDNADRNTDTDDI